MVADCRLPQNAVDCTTDAGFGSVAWTNPGNAVSASQPDAGNTYATSAPGAGQSSNWLKCVNYGFSLSPTDTVVGIEATWEVSASNNGRAAMVSERLVRAGTAEGAGTDKNDATALTTTDQLFTYGAPNDLWSASWSASDVNNSGFGAVMACQRTGNAVTCRTDSVRICVYYVAGATPTATATSAETATSTVTNTPVDTATATVTATNTPANTSTATSTATNTPVDTATATATDTPVNTATATSTATDTPVDTATATATGTVTNTSDATATVTPTPSPTATIFVSGNVLYYGSHVAVPAVSVVGGTDPNDPSPTTLVTDASGFYSFSGMVTPGNWWIEPNWLVAGAWPQTNIFRGVSSLDAGWIQEYMTASRSFNANQILAADTTGNGSVSSLDATRIQEYRVGIITRMPVATSCGSDFAFVPVPGPMGPPTPVAPVPSSVPCTRGAIFYDALSSGASGQNFDAVLFGDVTGNWTYGGGGSASLEALQNASEGEAEAEAEESGSAVTAAAPACDGDAACLALDPADVSIDSCGSTQVVIAAANLSGIQGVDLGIAIPASVEVASVKKGELARGQKCSLVSNVADGVLRISLSCVKPINGGGALLAVNLRGAANGSGALSFTKCGLNEGNPACETTGGNVSVGGCN